MILETSFQINGDIASTSGFAFWYLKSTPWKVLKDPGHLFGMNADYNGFGIFVFKSPNSNDFNVLGMFNKGMNYVTVDESKMNIHNSCKIQGNVMNTKRVLKVEYQETKVIVSIGEIDGG